jgi:hypothetical protein
MREIPILFSPAMVCAIAVGTKSQTRRTRGLKRINEAPDDWTLKVFDAVTGTARFQHKTTGEIIDAKCPYGVSGDRLWVRETHLIIGGKNAHSPRVIYRATNNGLDEWVSASWKPSIHMPRWASRYTLLRTTDRAPERVQDISSDDCRDEGADFALSGRYDFSLMEETPYHANFRRLWNSINGKRGLGWSVKPWVWPINFEVQS